jgi:hypothetical protein
MEFQPRTLTCTIPFAPTQLFHVTRIEPRARLETQLLPPSRMPGRTDWSGSSSNPLQTFTRPTNMDSIACCELCSTGDRASCSQITL